MQGRLGKFQRGGRDIKNEPLEQGSTLDSASGGGLGRGSSHQLVWPNLLGQGASPLLYLSSVTPPGKKLWFQSRTQVSLILSPSPWGSHPHSALPFGHQLLEVLPVEERTVGQD